MGAKFSTILSVVGVWTLLLLLFKLLLPETRNEKHYFSRIFNPLPSSKLFLPPRKLLKLDVLLLLLSGGFGFAIGYLQNSWPRSANEDSCCLFLASRIALGSVNWTGNSSLFRSNKETNQCSRRIVLNNRRDDAREKDGERGKLRENISRFSRSLN